MRHLSKSGIITLKALGGPIGSRTAQVQEQQLEETKFIAFFMGKKIDIDGKDLYDAKQKAITQLKVPKSKVGLLAVVSAESQRNQDFKFESVNEGKKVFKVNPGIGKAKYSISSHDGVKKHKDGSDFYDINIFKNKVDLEKGIKDYKSKGFVEESINEENPGLWANIRAKQARGEAPAPKNSKAYKDAVEAGDKIKNEQSIKREALKSIVKDVMQEEAEYQKFFQKVMDKAGKSIPSMSDEEKKAFFNKVDSAWSSRGEKNESTIKEGIWPKSKLAGQFQMQLSLQLKKHFKGIFYSVGYDLYHNDKKILTIDGDEDSINSVVAKLKARGKKTESVNEGIINEDFGTIAIGIMLAWGNERSFLLCLLLQFPHFLSLC